MSNQAFVPGNYKPLQIDDYRLREGGNDVTFVEISQPMRALPLSPSFILGPMSEADSRDMFSTTGTGPAGYYSIRNAVITFDGIVLHNGHFLTSLLTNFPEQHCLDMIRNIPEQVRSQAPRQLKGQAVLLTGPGFTTWGHWLVDFLPRLFLLGRAGWDITRIKWIIIKQTPHFARELLHLLGLPDDCLIEYDPGTEMLEVGDLIIPTNLSAGALMHPLFNEAVAWLKRRMNSVLIASAVRPSRVFISRSSAAFQRMLSNRDVIETIARAAGYTVIDPALQPVTDQLALFYGATRIVGEYGSGLHTSIFAPAGSMVICLRGPNHTAGVLQNGLARACGHKIGYIFGEAIPSSPIEAYSISKDLFQQALEYGELAV